ncbi:MAG TPA: hypothetical protein VK668_20945 [Mucilaginibacter sp.]|nr:hypothetical protein [Mucilaginibacter sp.]
MKRVQTNIVQEVKNWILSRFSEYTIIDDLYLIGSILSDSINFNDVDIVQNINFKNNNELKEYSKIVNTIKEEFLEKFKIALHITTFTQNEPVDLKKFMNKNICLKII